MRQSLKIAVLGALAVAALLLLYFISSRRGSRAIVARTQTGETGGEGTTLGKDGDSGEKTDSHSECGKVDTKSIVSWKHDLVTELQPVIRKNCEKLKLGIPQEQASVRLALSSWKPLESNQEYLRRMTQCPQALSEFTEKNFYNSAEEKAFPIAYVMVFHNNTRQILRLLKLLWRPQNVFCLHPDAKQSPEFVQFYKDFVSCFDNIFVASKLEKVVYAHHTIMDAQLNCMQDLMALEEARWKYIITLCGTELPLKTNREIVRGLKGIHGGSGITTYEMNDHSKRRFDTAIGLTEDQEHIRFTGRKLGKPPHGIQIRKSWDFFALTRPFVNFTLTDKRAIDFRKYCRGVHIPEEHFFASLYWMRDAPDGEFLRDKTGIVPLVSDMIWIDRNRKFGPRCAGSVVHDICILSSGDLRAVYIMGVLSHSNMFFYNKYFMHLDHVVMDCMEQRIVQQNKHEYIKDCLLS